MVLKTITSLDGYLFHLFSFTAITASSSPSSFTSNLEALSEDPKTSPLSYVEAVHVSIVHSLQLRDGLSREIGRRGDGGTSEVPESYGG